MSGINVNIVTITGNLVRDPEAREVGEGKVCSLTIANSRKYKDKSGEVKEETAFIDVECWAKTAELASQYLAKGSPVLIEGGLRQQSWQDKDGNKRTKILIRAERIHFIPDGKKRVQGGDGEAAPRAARPVPAAPADGEPPF